MGAGRTFSSSRHPLHSLLHSSPDQPQPAHPRPLSIVNIHSVVSAALPTTPTSPLAYLQPHDPAGDYTFTSNTVALVLRWLANHLGADRYFQVFHHCPLGDRNFLSMTLPLQSSF